MAHADQDKLMPAEQVERLDQALLRSGVRYEVEKYAGAIHGFTMADLPAYNQTARQRRWQKLIALLSPTFS